MRKCPIKQGGAGKKIDDQCELRKRLRMHLFFSLSMHLCDCDSSGAVGGGSHEGVSGRARLIRSLRSKLDLWGIKCPNKLKD